jgi:hypothetical protein
MLALGCAERNPAYGVGGENDGAVDVGMDDTNVDAAADVETPPKDALAEQPGAADVRADAGTDLRADSTSDALALNPLPDARPMGSGLRGDYFDGVELEAGVTGTLDLRRVDAMIDFDWGTGRPSAAVDDDYFSVRWTGQVMPLYSETYTFTTLTDEGVRLWVNGTLLIDRWVNQTATMHSASLALVAGRRYDVKMEYFEATGAAVAKLYWASATQRMELVPTSCLFPP